MVSRTFKLYTHQIPLTPAGNSDQQVPDWDGSEIEYPTDYEESSAKSSPQSRSSSIPNSDMFEDLSLLLDPTDLMDDSDDDEFFVVQAPKKRRSSPLSDIEKTRLVLQFMRESLSRFSLAKFFDTLFSADDSGIKNFTSIFLSRGGLLKIMDLCWDPQDKAAVEWVVDKAAISCSKEASLLSDRASRGNCTSDVQFLQVSSHNVDINMLNQFRIHNLRDLYERITPCLQKILRSVVGNKDRAEGSRNPDAGRTLITSMLLNLRSRRLNYHNVINSLLFWDNRVPKRLIQTLNQLGITTSYAFQVRAVNSISKSAIKAAQEAANNPTKIKMLPYDNFNWTSRVWESTALHGNITHDEVSALLVILPVPPGGSSAQEIANIQRFQISGTNPMRHTLPLAKSLSDILPSSLDQQTFRLNAIIHVQHILAQDFKSLNKYSSLISSFEDKVAIPPRRTEEYYLPTFDQEQGSTRGNMVVLQHYFGKVLNIPKETFERTMFLVLGDRLTTVRDRAAQDQRAVDRSAHRFDHLSSYSMISGLMHFVLNFIEALSRNAWGSPGSTDPVSLMVLRDILPNRHLTINPKKIDYYGWLRFLDVILRSLVIQAALMVTKSTTPDTIPARILTLHGLEDLAIKVVDGYLIPSPTRLEATGTKILHGNTMCGHAMLLMRDLMMLREMQHAIKNGHPTRIQRMLKFWMPMFYAAGSYNYANECMELLHNVIHDWPRDFSQIAFNGMLVNPTGRLGGWKPTDLRVEHLNDRIKERAHGPNATPELLAKITPAMGHISALTDQLFDDLEIELQNQQHAQVLQHKDVHIVIKHFMDNKLFNFLFDKLSPHAEVDLYQTGCVRVAGPGGGHANHLKRHKTRLLSRHNTDIHTTSEVPSHEEISYDSGQLNFTVREGWDEFAYFANYYNANESDNSGDDDIYD